MLIKTGFAGFGGQGVMSMGLNLAQAGMMENKFVTYLPSYGAEVRGGTANCTVAISDEEIASPIASSPDYIVAMNQPSLVRFQNRLESGGLVFINSTLVKCEISRRDIDIASVAANEIAEKLKNPQGANMVMLGAFIKKTNLVSLSSIIDGLKIALKSKPRLISINQEALNAGFNLF